MSVFACKRIFDDVIYDVMTSSPRNGVADLQCWTKFSNVLVR